VEDQLLVRAYNVGLGDCIYIKVPDFVKEEGDSEQPPTLEQRHILIDCGNIDADAELIGEALSDLRGELPVGPDGNPRLDLLVVSHRHSDHIAGFLKNRQWFEGITIGNIWLSAALNPDHEQAREAQGLHGFAQGTLGELSRAALSQGYQEVVMQLVRIDIPEAMKILRETLAANSNLSYVHAGMTPDELGTSQIFSESTTSITILNPQNNIDREYLGKTGTALTSFKAFSAMMSADSAPVPVGEVRSEADAPKNIGAGDFRRLRDRLMSNALAFVLDDGEIANNTSVAVLLEWRGRRLLFTGDAEWTKGGYKEGKRNGAWDTMWHYQQDDLSKPLDLWVAGHHGSHNATPFHGEEPHHFTNVILDALLPSGEKAGKVLVSTERKEYPTIPDPALLTELGSRVACTHQYNESEVFEARYGGAELPKKWEKLKAKVDRFPEDVLVADGTPQPPRTDMEHHFNGEPYVQELLSAHDDWQLQG
jgi:glyoxylase-like metal-dependent hydrolase (beta-lactamase superfamily II)